MNHSTSGDTLSLFPSGEISSLNAAKIDEEIGKIIAESTFRSIQFDFAKVTYISSAGLRVLLKLVQKFHNVTIINASTEVYEVFEMTGFTKLMNVEKRLAEIDVTGAEIIGEGYFSIVYRINKDTIIKVFRQSPDIADVRRELNLAKQAFVLGIPTAISFDVVKVQDKLGVRFEMLDCASLRDVFRDKPERYEEMVQKYAELLRIINTTSTDDPAIPDCRDIWRVRIEACRPFLNDAQYQKLLSMFEAIPARDTFVHGDCHFKNIMVQNDDLLLIDMDTLSKGNPIFELSAIYAPYVAFEEDDPGNSERFLGLPASFIQPMYKDLLNRYLGGLTDETYRKIALLAYAHMIWWNQANEPQNKVRHEGNLSRLKALLDQVNDLDIGK